MPATLSPAGAGDTLSREVPEWLGAAPTKLHAEHVSQKGRLAARYLVVRRTSSRRNWPNFASSGPPRGDPRRTHRGHSGSGWNRDDSVELI